MLPFPILYQGVDLSDILLAFLAKIGSFPANVLAFCYTPVILERLSSSSSSTRCPADCLGKDKHLARLVRVTLEKIVLTAMETHNLNKILRNSVQHGEDIENALGRHSMVNSTTVCQLKALRGLELWIWRSLAGR